MTKILVSIVFTAIYCWSIPRPMESIENYNILMVHGAYGSNKNYMATIKDSLIDTLGFLEGMNNYVMIDLKSMKFVEASKINHFIGEANLGEYDNGNRITKWLNKYVFEDDSSKFPQTSYIYNWRSFSNPANTSLNNAYELGGRTWNKGNKSYGEGGFGYRRALVEEAQEVKSVAKDDSGKVYYGQTALDFMRKNSDLYRQLASRYVLIGHSMGGVVSREYVQGNFYNGDVDKIIALDSPHEGTGALNMQLGLLLFCSEIRRKSFKENRV